MLARFTKAPPAAPADQLACVRPDGSASVVPLPREGVLPREAVHFVAETVLGWHDALFGLVAAGADAPAVAARARALPSGPVREPQLHQSSALAECLQAELWGGASDPAAFAEKLILACRRRGVPPPDLDAEELARVRLALREFGAAWRPLGPGQSLERTFAT